MKDDLRRAVLDANCGIIGIGPGPHMQADDSSSWPTDGYDSVLVKYDWDSGVPGSFAWSGYSREEWLELADEMLRRWTEFRAAIEQKRA